MPSPLYLQIEQHIAIAHRQVLRAAVKADGINAFGTHADLTAIAYELMRIQTSLLRGPDTRIRPPLREGSVPESGRL